MRWRWLALAVLAPAAALAQHAAPRSVAPVLAFPEAGLDDTAAYNGYATRLYRDSKNNTVQIYRGPRDGRMVLLWADALDESAAFTVRDASGRAAAVEWGADSALVSDSAGARTVTYRLNAAAPSVTVGWFLLGTMRVERDFQYAKWHLKPFSALPFVIAPETLLVSYIARLPAGERDRQLALLHASSTGELRARLQSPIVLTRSGTSWRVRVERIALDGQSRIAMELSGDAHATDVRASGRTVAIRALRGRNVPLEVTVTTTGAPLTPLSRTEIFNAPFLSWLASSRGTGDTAERYRRLEREVRSVELLSSREKLMAGLPNYATYFGRDGMMTALMMRTIWTPVMAERVIASVLGKLGPAGDVSHEEALGEQAIREHADEYNAAIAAYDSTHADSALSRARDVLAHIRRVRENYYMMDDEFQLPVLEARYLEDSTVQPERKREFLAERASTGETHLALMLREMALVSRETAPYAQHPSALNLVSFQKRDSTHWRSASWRDSDVGYANGRFAMDINAIWAPRALESIASALASLRALGYSRASLDSAAPELARSPVGAWASDSTALRGAIDTWRGARELFMVRLTAQEATRRIHARLAALPAAERAYWEKKLAATPVKDSVIFLALALDARGTPIPVANTDPSTEMFLTDSLSPEHLRNDLGPFVRAYPVGLFVAGLGPVVANDAYGSPAVWDMFRNDLYHSPRVVWGREVNLFLLGVAERVGRSQGMPAELRDSLRTALDRTLAAVAASHVQHNELWSYRIVGSALEPSRYGTGSDVQLWSTTDLAVQFALSRLGQR